MKYQYSLILRSLLIFLPLAVFYFIFSPLTIFPVYYILTMFDKVTLLGNSIIIQDYTIDIISACIAGSAYYLLYLLILLTKDIKLKSRVFMFLTGGLLILSMNILRIVLLVCILLQFGSNYFDKVHLLFWNLLSGVYVALVWIFLVLKFKIKSTPIYSDFKYLYKESLFKNRGKK